MTVGEMVGLDGRGEQAVGGHCLIVSVGNREERSDPNLDDRRATFDNEGDKGYQEGRCIYCMSRADSPWRGRHVMGRVQAIPNS